MFQKRGQITVFIILGILLLFATILFLTFKNQVERIDNIHIETDHIKTYISNCIDLVGFEGLVKAGKQGGYIEVPYVIGMLNTSYWYTTSANIQPFLFEIEDGVSEYIEENLESCINYSSFTDLGYVIDAGEIDANVLIAENHVDISVDYPIDVSKKNQIKKISQFYVKIPLKIKKMYEISTDIVNRATLPGFDRCNPICNDTGNITIKTFNVDYYTVYNTQITFVTDDGRMIPYDLDFAIEVNDSSGPYYGTKKIALVYYDAGPESWTFGTKAKEVFESMHIPIDYYDCAQRSKLYSKLNEYSRIIITGAVDYDEGKGCPILREYPTSPLKEWVHSGGSLYINDPDIAPIEGYHSETTSQFCGEQYNNNLTEPEHNLLVFPNDIRDEIESEVWFDACTDVSGDDKIIMTSPKGKALLWISKRGKGNIIFDQFVFSAGAKILAESDFVENLDLAKKYYENVLAYMFDPCLNPEVIPGCSYDRLLDELIPYCDDLTDGEIYGLRERSRNETCLTFECETSQGVGSPDYNDLVWSICIEENNITLDKISSETEHCIEGGFSHDFLDIGSKTGVIVHNGGGSTLEGSLCVDQEHLEWSCKGDGNWTTSGDVEAECSPDKSQDMSCSWDEDCSCPGNVCVCKDNAGVRYPFTRDPGVSERGYCGKHGLPCNCDCYQKEIDRECVIGPEHALCTTKADCNRPEGLPYNAWGAHQSECCNGHCAAFISDPCDCGGCGIICSMNETCTNGVCV